MIPLCASHADSEINAEAKEWSWFCLGQNRGFGTRVREPEQISARSLKGMYLSIHREDRTGTLENNRIEVSHDYQKRVVYPRKHRFLLMLPVDNAFPSHGCAAPCAFLSAIQTHHPFLLLTGVIRAVMNIFILPPSL